MTERFERGAQGVRDVLEPQYTELQDAGKPLEAFDHPIRTVRRARPAEDTHMLRLTRFAALALAALALSSGCATMNVSSHIERGADFTHYRTWDWGPADALPTGDPRLDNNPFFQDHLLGEVEKQMTRKGYVRSELAGSPDLLVHYHANIGQRFEVTGVDNRNRYCDEDCQPRVAEFEEGTLVLDVVDTHTNKLVWRGWAQDSMEGVIDNQDGMERHIEQAVRRMFARFPPTL